MMNKPLPPFRVVISAAGSTSKRGYGGSDTFHLSEVGNGAKTLCGRSTAGWHRGDIAEDAQLQSVYLCAKCRAKA